MEKIIILLTKLVIWFTNVVTFKPILYLLWLVSAYIIGYWMWIIFSTPIVVLIDLFR